MMLFLAKLLPLFVLPLGLTAVLLLVVLLMHQRPQVQKKLIMIALVLLWLCSTRPVATVFVRSLEQRHVPTEAIPEADVIVVLGGATRPLLTPRPTVEINEAGDRLIYGSWLYHQGKAKHILLSGGRIPWLAPGVNATEADEMMTLLMMLNVPQDVVWLEDQSNNTYENALYTYEILQSYDINRIILVTSALHMPRSVGLFESQGFEVIPAPTDFVVTDLDWDNLTTSNMSFQLLNLWPTVESLHLTSRALREYMGLTFYSLQGKLGDNS